MTGPGPGGPPDGGPVDDVVALRRSVLDLHARVDEWAAVVEGVAEESAGDSTEAMADPRLEAAQDRFYEHLARFEDASLPVLGLVVDEAEEPDDESTMSGDDFYLHFLVGVAPSAPDIRLDEAFELIHRAGHDLVDRLVGAGFEVPTFAASRGEPDLPGYDADDDEEEEL